MRFSVRWSKVAENQLASIWIAASDRSVVTAAASEIDAVLRDRADQVGESRPADGTRILFERPLGVVFDLMPEDAVVRVLRVWRF